MARDLPERGGQAEASLRELQGGSFDFQQRTHFAYLRRVQEAEEAYHDPVRILQPRMNDVLTASRMNSLARCARQHFWKYEVGLRKKESTPALRFGTAWACAMEVRWNGGEYGAAVGAVPERAEMDAYAHAAFAALLAAYYLEYGLSEAEGTIEPEVRLPGLGVGDTGFVADGKMDGLGWLKDRGEALIESKTTRSRLDDDSPYWHRLKFNVQVLQYLAEARRMGRNPVVAFYDVTRKPQIRPKMVADLDADGKRIVLNADGSRATKEVGKKGEKRTEFKQTPGDGQRYKEHFETPDEFAERVWLRATADPSFYFRRWEMPVLDDQIAQFERHRIEQAELIKHYRSREEREFGRDPDAWPMNVQEQTCNSCEFSSFCLQSISVNLDSPPSGFEVGAFNPELKEENDDQQNDDDATAE